MMRLEKRVISISAIALVVSLIAAGAWISFLITQMSQEQAGRRGHNLASFVVAAHDSMEKGDADFVCDGTDDQAEINAAVDNLPDAGGSIFLKDGTYVLSADIIISKSNVSLIGAGASTVIRIKDGKNAGMRVFYASKVANLLIRDLCIDGNGANQIGGDMYGIYFEGVRDSKIVDCWVENLRKGGIYLVSSDYNTIAGNTCQGNHENSIQLESSTSNVITGNACRGSMRGIYLHSSHNNTVANNVCHGNVYQGIYLVGSYYNTMTGNACQWNGGMGIALNSSNNNTLTGNACLGNGGIGLTLDSIIPITGGITLEWSHGNAIAGNACEWNVYRGIHLVFSDNNAITGSTCQGNKYDGIYLLGSHNNSVTGNTCQANGGVGIPLDMSDNNIIAGNSLHGNSDGIYLSSSSNNAIDGNICQGNSQHGIFLSSSSNNAVTGNTVDGNSQARDNAYDGIFVGFRCGHNGIRGNTVRRGTGAKRQRYGVRIESADCENNLIINNDLYQAGVAGDNYDAGTGTIFRNNRLTVGWATS